MKTNLKDNIFASSQLHHHVPGLPVHVPSLQPDGDDSDDIYIMMKCLSVCLSVTKNHHFLFGFSCNHRKHP